MRINVFLSLAGEGGKKLAQHLKSELEALRPHEGLQFSCYLYSEDQDLGGRIHDYYVQIESSNFFIPVLTSEYCESNRIHIKNELESALIREDHISIKSNGKFKFIFPYGLEDGNEILCKIPRLNGRIFTANVEKLAESMLKSSPFALLYEGDKSFGFEQDWPRRFFTEDGEPDTLLVLGHSGKEKPPKVEDFVNLRSCTIEKELAFRYNEDASSMPRQSMRIAEYLPHLIQFLSNQYLRFKPNSTNIPLIPSDIDWHLIKYRYELLAAHNLICFGAGDTNWISRAVLAYYDTLLPVVFDMPGGSHSLHLRTTMDINKGSGKEDATGRIEVFKYTKSWESVEANDSFFSAVLLIVPNPWNTDKKVIIAAGLTGLGSQAAILALCDPSITTTPLGGMPWARVIRGIEGEKSQAWKAIGFKVVA